MELKVEDLTFPVERIRLYESQIELRAENRLRRAGLARQFSGPASTCILRVDVTPQEHGFRVRVLYGPRDGVPAFATSETVAAPTPVASAEAVLAAVDRQIDRFVASVRTNSSGPAPVAGTATPPLPLGKS